MGFMETVVAVMVGISALNVLSFLVLIIGTMISRYRE